MRLGEEHHRKKEQDMHVAPRQRVLGVFEEYAHIDG